MVNITAPALSYMGKPTLTNKHTNWDLFRKTINTKMNLRFQLKSSADIDDVVQRRHPTHPLQFLTKKCEPTLPSRHQTENCRETALTQKITNNTRTSRQDYFQSSYHTPQNSTLHGKGKLNATLPGKSHPYSINRVFAVEGNQEN